MSAAKSWEKAVAVGAGIAFLVILLLIAVFIARPTEFQIFVFRVVLSIAAGAFGSIIPGFIQLDVSIAKTLSLRAAGALALFATVFLVNPPALLTEKPPPEPQTNSARPEIQIRQGMFADARVSLRLASRDAREASVESAKLEITCPAGSLHGSTHYDLHGSTRLAANQVTTLELMPFVGDVPICVPSFPGCTATAVLAVGAPGYKGDFTLRATPSNREAKDRPRHRVVLYRYSGGDNAMYQDVVGALRTSLTELEPSADLALVELPDAALDASVHWSRPQGNQQQLRIAGESGALALLSGDVVLNDQQIRLRVYIPDGSDGGSWEVGLPSRNGEWFETIRGLHTLALLYALALAEDSSRSAQNDFLGRALAQADSVRRTATPEVVTSIRSLEERILKASERLNGLQRGS